MKKFYRLLRHDWPLHFVLLLTNWLPDNGPFLRLRGFLARPLLGKCGSGVTIGRNVTLYNPSKIQIGNNVYIAYGCWFMAGEIITVEDGVMFGPYCLIVSSTYQRVQRSFRIAEPKREPIEIGSDSWIGGNVVVTAGSIIGSGTVIGANSVVKGRIPANAVAAGQPARVLREFEDEDASVSTPS